MKKLLIVTTLLTLSPNALAEHRCATAATKAVLNKVIQSLDKGDLEQLSLEVIGTEHVKVVKKKDVFNVAVRTNLPGWQVYEVRTSGKNCAVAVVSLVNEE